MTYERFSARVPYATLLRALRKGMGERLVKRMLSVAIMMIAAVLSGQAKAQSATESQPSQTRTTMDAEGHAPPADATNQDVVAPEAAGGDGSDVAGTASPDDEAEFTVSQPADALFSSDLLGSDVYGTADEKIGDINDLLIGATGDVEAVIIGIGGFLGVGEKDIAVPLASLNVEEIDNGHRISFDATEDELLDAPEFVRADGTSSDRLGAFERAYQRNRARAESALDTIEAEAIALSEDTARELSDLSDQARAEVDELIERARRAGRDLVGPDEPPQQETQD